MGLAILSAFACSAPGLWVSVDDEEAGLTVSGVQADLSVQSDWGGGYCAAVTLSNRGPSRVTSWSVVVELNQSKVTNAGSAALALNGTRGTFAPAGTSSAIQPGQAVSFGFCSASTGSDHRPILTSLSVQGGGTAADGSSSSRSGGADAGRAPDAGSEAPDAGAAATMTTLYADITAR